MEALAMLEQEPVDLLIVDVMLAPPMLQLRSKPVERPFENGMRVVQEALAKRPDTPVLFISSHSQMTLLSKGVNGNRWPVLRKPFSPTVTIRLDAAREKTAGVGPQTHPRYPIQCPVHYTGDHEGHGVTKNLSLGGCLLKVATPVEVDAHLTLQLALPNDPVPIKIHVAVARWSAPLICGLDFLLIDEHGERLLLEYLKRFMAEQGQP